MKKYILILFGFVILVWGAQLLALRVEKQECAAWTDGEIMGSAWRRDQCRQFEPFYQQ